MRNSNNSVDSTNPVSKGFEFEKAVEVFLNSCGFKAYRTNKANPSDPQQCKAGFDGGVDIIATFEDHTHIDKRFIFYIQCKNQKSDLTKTAISEVYAGMHFRNGFSDISIPVVITTANVSQETRQFAKKLKVELITGAEYSTVLATQYKKEIVYNADYGILMKCMLYCHTKDTIWLNTLPTSVTNIPTRSTAERYIEESSINFDKAQSYLDTAIMFERKANENRQKALDIQKATVFQVLHAANYIEKSNNKKHTGQSDETTIDSG